MAAIMHSADLPVKILQITDSHLFAGSTGRLMGLDTNASFQAVLDLIIANERRPDLILLTGDLAQDSSEEAYAHMATQLSNFKVPLYCLPGNHDKPRLMRETFEKLGFSQDSEIDTGAWQILLMNSHQAGKVAGRVTKSDLKQLEQRLKQSSRHQLICLHHQPVPVGCRWLDKIGLDNAQDFMRIVNQADNVRAVLFGHVHQHFEAQHSKLHLMSTPSTCFQFAANSDDFATDETIGPGYRWLELMPDGSISTEVCRVQNFKYEMDENHMGY